MEIGSGMRITWACCTGWFGLHWAPPLELLILTSKSAKSTPAQAQHTQVQRQWEKAFCMAQRTGYAL